MKSDEIEKYLTELGRELQNRGIKKPVRLMLIGGAYMLLLANAPRSTNDIDVFWLEEDAFQQTLNPLRESVQAITKKYTLNPDWFNYLTQMIIYDEIIVPESKLWKRFGPLHLFVPTKEYILALKIMAGRDKDLDDCAILLPQTRIATRQQAQQLLDRYILPEGQEKHAEQIEHALRELFAKKE
jgi:Nucleotidyltransferase of unknown function (DUF6036)